MLVDDSTCTFLNIQLSAYVEDFLVALRNLCYFLKGHLDNKIKELPSTKRLIMEKLLIGLSMRWDLSHRIPAPLLWILVQLPRSTKRWKNELLAGPGGKLPLRVQHNLSVSVERCEQQEAVQHAIQQAEENEEREAK